MTVRMCRILQWNREVVKISQQLKEMLLMRREKEFAEHEFELARWEIELLRESRRPRDDRKGQSTRNAEIGEPSASEQ